MAISLLTGTVKYTAGRTIQTQYGDRVNAVVELENGEEVKVWGNPGSTIVNLKKGQTVQLIYDGKSHKLVTDQTATTADKSQPSLGLAELTPDQKRQLAREIEAAADVLKYCHQIAQSKFELEQSEVCALAIALFTHATKVRD